jgi:hypothetical protein
MRSSGMLRIENQVIEGILEILHEINRLWGVMTRTKNGPTQNLYDLPTVSNQNVAD